jgi:hypothetical protein
MSNYSINGVILASSGCIFQNGPSDNEFGVAPEIDNTPVTPVVEEPQGDGTGTETPIDNGENEDPLIDDGITMAGSGISSGASDFWVLLALILFIRRRDKSVYSLIQSRKS